MTNEEAKELLDNLIGMVSDNQESDYDTALKMGIKALDQEPKTGHWIMSNDGMYRPICDKCGAHPWKGYIPTVEEAQEVFKYCPNCGARMERQNSISK